MIKVRAWGPAWPTEMMGWAGPAGPGPKDCEPPLVPYVFDCTLPYAHDSLAEFVLEQEPADLLT